MKWPVAALLIVVVAVTGWMFHEASDSLRQSIWSAWETLVLVAIGGGMGGAAGLTLGAKRMSGRLDGIEKLLNAVWNKVGP